MKKFFLTIALFIVTLAMAGCGGGTGSSSQPKGVNAGVPSVIHLMSVQQIAQTNSYVPVKARVLDGNGNLLPGVPVTFTNLSLVGNLSATTATTDQQGIATVNLSSTTSGFSTVQAEVNTGSGMVRDKWTVFFSDYSLTLTQPAPTLALDVDGNNNGIYNEPSDFILFETPDDNEVIVRATLTAGGLPISGSLITFGADTAEGTFPLGDTATTDNNGQASVLVKVDPTVLRNFKTVLNITATAADSSGNTIAENIVSLFLNPVTVDTISVTTDSQTVASGATAAVTAQVMTTAGSGAPDGTAVDFSATDGSVTPFAQTSTANGVSGVATATFTAPTLPAGSSDEQVIIYASSGGKKGYVTITVKGTPLPLAVNPAQASISCADTTAVVTFSVVGGVPGYTVQSSSSLVTATPASPTAPAYKFTVKLTSPGTCTGLPASTEADVLVTDKDGTIVTVPVTVTNPGAP